MKIWFGLAEAFKSYRGYKQTKNKTKSQTELKRDRFSVALYATEERSPELWSNNEANWMVSTSAKLDHRTKQHTQFGVSVSNGSRDMARTKSWRNKRKEKKKKNYEANWMVSNSAKLDRRNKQHTQFGVSASNGSRDMTRTKSWRKKRKEKNKKK